MDLQRAIVLGHSYVVRLQDFMSGTRYDNFGLRRATVQCLGFGGAAVTHCARRLDRVLDLSCCFDASVVILHVGENDSGRISSRSAAQGIYDLALSLVYHYRVRYYTLYDLNI